MPSDSPTFPLISQDIMDTLRDEIGEETFYEALVAFIEEINDSLNQIQQTHAMAQLVTHAHSLKSSARMFGAMALAETAFELEKAARAQNTEHCQSILPRLVSHCQNTQTLLTDISQASQV
jgi:HPt (histidine-containing phosphotransfer) domain-containing protein